MPLMMVPGMANTASNKEGCGAGGAARAAGLGGTTVALTMFGAFTPAAVVGAANERRVASGAEWASGPDDRSDEGFTNGLTATPRQSQESECPRSAGVHRCADPMTTDDGGRCGRVHRRRRGRR